MRALVILFVVFVTVQGQGGWTPPPKDGTLPPKDGWTPPPKDGTLPPKGSWTPPDGWTPPPKDGTLPPKDGWTPPDGGFTPPPKDGNPPNGGGGGDTPDDTPEPTEKPTSPTACSAANQGRCDCGDPSDGFQTYTFWLGDVQRCFTVFRPNSRSSEVLPVVLAPNCYAKDKLSGIEGLSTKSDGNVAAERYGFARIGLSTPDGGWTFGNDGIVNDDIPMPCSDEDSKDMPYLKAVFAFIEGHPEMFDSDKVYAVGFSQNSMFSAYIGFCFNEKVRGIWQGGSGMALNGQLPNLPGCQGQVTASDFAQCTGCQQCITTNFCEECQYWPIYPCYSANRPMVDCVAEYVNDKIAVSPEDPDTFSSGLYMFERLLNEGHDGRFFRFSPSDDGTIPGSHQDPKNKDFWQVGCLGITESCPESCSNAFVDCVNSKDVSTASNRVESFQSCIEPGTFSGLGCPVDCSPTFAMMSASEEPTEAIFDTFGAGSDSAEAKPATSKCDASSN